MTKRNVLSAPELADELEALAATLVPRGLTAEQQALVDKHYATFAAACKLRLLAEKVGVDLGILRNYAQRNGLQRVRE